MSNEPRNRIKNVVEAFNFSANQDASAYEIQDPLRTLINKILDQQNETREEIIEQAAGPIFRRVERQMERGAGNVYIRTNEDETLPERIKHGCTVFYDEVFEDMLDADRIRLANQRNDILDAFYLIVRQDDK